MNSSELQLVETTIQGLMNSNNDLRKVSECQLEQLMNNKPLLILTLSQLLNATSDQSILIYASVILRKLLDVQRPNRVNVIWEASPIESKEQIKENILFALTNHKTNKAFLKKIADLISALSESIFNSNDTWDQILKYVINGFMIELNNENQITIEISVYLLGKIFSFSYSQLIQGIDVFIKGFGAIFAKGTIDMKTNAVQAICEILNDPDNKKSSDKFAVLTYNILETTLACLNSADYVNLKTCLLSLGALSHSLPKMLKSSFKDIFILMGKIVETKDFDSDDSIYSLAYEVLLSIISKYPSVISKKKDNIVLLINSLFKFGMKFDNTIDDEWLTPKSTSLIHENIIYEENLDHALSLIERLILALPKDKILTYVSAAIMELLQHSNEDWRHKYIAYMTIGKLSHCFEDIKTLEKLIEIILGDIDNANPKIKYSCINCLFYFTNTFKEDFTSLYHETALPKIVSILKADLVLRVRLQACEAIKVFIDKCEKNIIDIYLESILDALFGQFTKSNTECPVSLRELILDTLEELIKKTPESFPAYAEKCFNILVEYLKIAITSTDNSLLNLVSFLFDILTNVGQHCPDLLNKYSKDIINTLIHFQNHIVSFKGQIANKFVNAWERLIDYIKASHQELIPSLMASIFKVIKQQPEMSIASNPNVKIDIQEFLSDVNDQKPKEILLKVDNLSIITSETEEYTVFLQLFNLFLESFKEYGIQYIEPTEIEVKRLSSYPNQDIRIEATMIYPLLLQIVKCTCAKEAVGEYLKKYISIIIDLISKEQDTKIVRCWLDAITNLIDNNDNVLIKEDLNTLFSSLFGIFDYIETSRIAIVNQKSENEAKLFDGHQITTKDIKGGNAFDDLADKDEDDGDDYEDYDSQEDEDLDKLNDIEEVINNLEEVLISFSEVIGKLFKTHKMLSLELAKKLFENVLPKYLDQNASEFEKKMGLYILDDLVEHFGQEHLEYVWANICKILLTYCLTDIDEIRQAASYGLGEFIKQTKNNFNQYANDILTTIQSGLKMKKGNHIDTEFLQAQDNIATALGKLIKYQSNSYQLNQLIPLWVNYLPIVNDPQESFGMHDLLCDIITTQPTLILGNNYENAPNIIKILCKIVNSKKYSNDDIDAKIKRILEEFANNATIRPAFALAEKDCPGKLLVKIKNFSPK